MKLSNNKKLQNYLELRGFKEIWLDDNSGFWMEKKIKHKFLKSCKVVVDELDGEAIILIECNTIDDGMGWIEMGTLYQNKFSKKLLSQILVFLN